MRLVADDIISSAIHVRGKRVGKRDGGGDGKNAYLHDMTHRRRVLYVHTRARAYIYIVSCDHGSVNKMSDLGRGKGCVCGFCGRYNIYMYR